LNAESLKNKLKYLLTKINLQSLAAIRFSKTRCVPRQTQQSTKNVRQCQEVFFEQTSFFPEPNRVGSNGTLVITTKPAHRQYLFLQISDFFYRHKKHSII
jgi:hypothetical protein